MARPDVPIAKWVGHPASWTVGRRNGQPSVIVIHTTDGSEGPLSAEGGAAYDKRRTDGTSTHFFVDQDTVVQELEIRDEAHAARTHGNDIGIHIEICGLAAQSTEQWNDKASAATLENVAQLCAQLGRGYPLVRLQGQALRNAWSNNGMTRGYCGHVDITEAFPEDHGTHTDPGHNFPWAKLFTRIAELESSMSPEEFWYFPIANPYNDDKPQPAAGLLSYVGSRQGISEEVDKVIEPRFAALEAKMDLLKAALANIENKIGL
jgi:hypothetical protein